MTMTTTTTTTRMSTNGTRILSSTPPSWIPHSSSSLSRRCCKSKTNVKIFRWTIMTIIGTQFCLSYVLHNNVLSPATRNKLQQRQQQQPTKTMKNNMMTNVRTWTVHVKSIFDDDDDDDDEMTTTPTNDGIDLKNFNPFQYKVSGTNSISSSFGTDGGIQRISLRQTRMDELTNELFDVVDVDVGDESKDVVTLQILQKYKDFLLEPLEDTDAVLEPDSIYTPNMTRMERYQMYRQSMEERIINCKNKKVKSILISMKEYVLSFEKEDRQQEE